jgi:uncharacterized protein (TIGR02246 family)
VIAAVAAAAAAVAVGSVYRSRAGQESAAPPKEAAGQKETKKGTPEAVARKRAAEYVRAFNKQDAKAAAAFWAEDGEYISPEGDTVRGRKALEKSYAAFFKANPKAKLEIEVKSVRLFGRHTALEEGTLRLKLPGESAPTETHYSAVHERDNDKWLTASVREWVPDPVETVSVKDLAWLVGDWEGKAEGIEVHTRYSWDEDKTFLHCRYTVKKDGKTLASGRQVIGKDPVNGLRAWLFDRSGSIGESDWSKDGNRWVIEAVGTLPDGTAVTATNVLIPLGKDAFTWQSVDRTVAGVEVPDTAPIKVTRVKAGR